MALAAVYVLRWGGTWSNVVMALGCVLFIAVTIYFVVTVLRAIQDYRRHKYVRGALRSWATFGLVLEFIACIVLGGFAGASAGASRGISEGAVQGYARSQRPNRRVMLAVSIIGIPLMISAIYVGIFRERPLAISVSQHAIELRYRLRWRNWSIPLDNIKQLGLEERQSRGDGGFKYNVVSVVIKHDRVVTMVSSDGSPQSAAQLRAAYNEMEGYLSSEHKNSRDIKKPTLRPSATTAIRG